MLPTILSKGEWLVTTVTTITVTTVSTIAAMGLAATISIAAILVLIAFLASKELASASPSPSPFRRLIARFLNIGIVPLLMVFAVVVATKIAEALA